MKNRITVRLRPIRPNSITDKENHFALQKSVAILENWKRDNEDKLNEWLWQDIFKNKNRICYAIEKMPEKEYCGECAVKNISDEIPEIEIELMKEYQGQGIGYFAIVDMLNKLAAEYGKKTYYAKIEPDNYTSRFLFEKLGGKPAGVARDCTISEERAEQFTERSAYLLDRDLEETAKKFGVKAEVLLTHFLVYKININDVIENYNEAGKSGNHREKIDCPRKLTKEKYKETLREFLEGLQQIKEAAVKEELITKLNEMEEKAMDRVNKLSESIMLK